MATRHSLILERAVYAIRHSIDTAGDHGLPNCRICWCRYTNLRVGGGTIRRLEVQVLWLIRGAYSGPAPLRSGKGAVAERWAPVVDAAKFELVGSKVCRERSFGGSAVYSAQLKGFSGTRIRNDVDTRGGVDARLKLEQTWREVHRSSRDNASSPRKRRENGNYLKTPSQQSRCLQCSKARVRRHRFKITQTHVRSVFHCPIWE
jgi:hypothetical protein